MTPTTMKIDWQWAPVIVYLATMVALVFLVHTGKLHPEALISLISWLAPGPWQTREGRKTDIPPKP